MRFKSGLICSIIAVVLIAGSCSDNRQDERPPEIPENTREPKNDMPVKEITPDSSSQMPVAVPKDSTEEIPNPYKPKN